MKNRLLLLIIPCFIFCQCSQDGPQVPEIDKDQASIQLMKLLEPRLTGTWNMKYVQIRHQYSTFHGELNIRKDTTLTDFATLTLAPAARQVDPARSRYEGSIQYGRKTYPVRMDLLAGPWIFNRKGPQAYFLLEYNFPAGSSHSIETEEYFLQQIGLVLETFSLEDTGEQPIMVWRGLNRGIEQLTFSRK